MTLSLAPALRPCEGQNLLFSFGFRSLYWNVPGSPGYDDKLWRAIDAADPGAVPGDSTKTPLAGGALTGSNQDRRVLKGAVFARAE